MNGEQEEPPVTEHVVAGHISNMLRKVADAAEGHDDSSFFETLTKQEAIDLYGTVVSCHRALAMFEVSLRNMLLIKHGVFVVPQIISQDSADTLKALFEELKKEEKED